MKLRNTVLALAAVLVSAAPAFSAPEAYRSRSKFCRPSGIQTSIKYCVQPRTSAWSLKMRYKQTITVRNMNPKNGKNVYYKIDGKDYSLVAGASKTHKITRIPNGDYTMAIPVAFGDNVYGYDSSYTFYGETPKTVNLWTVEDFSGKTYFRSNVK